MKKKKLKKISKIVLAILLIVFMVFQYISVDTLLESIKPLKNRDSDVIVTYENSSKTESKVNLKKGSISFEDPDKLDSYVLDYIDNFDLSFNYNFSADKLVDAKVNYQVQSELIAYYKESVDLSSNPKIWNKKDTIKEENLYFNSNSYSLNVPVNIVLNDYLTIMNDFQKAIDIPIDGYILVNLVVNIDGNVDGDVFNSSYTDTIKIPITKSVIKVNSSTKEPISEVVYVEGVSAKSMRDISINIALALINFIILVVIIRLLFLQNKVSKYDLMVSKILRNYDDIIINTSTCIELDKYNIIEIVEFKELLNLAREYSIPIFYFQYSDKKVSLFYILKNDNLYLYAIGG